ncbi:hypothetical protein B0H14DRAFT_3447588 [Mycena olivaceomarginata]|nr:hypothetical protein B0H14DRAFT_3447588 [Mycena olivaceomarginata]
MPSLDLLARWTSRTRGVPRDIEFLSRPDCYSLTLLPNELIFVLLKCLDDKSLRIMVTVSKRLSNLAIQALVSRCDISPAGDVTVNSSDALRSLRVLMTHVTYQGAFKSLSHLIPPEPLMTNDIRRLMAILNRACVGPARMERLRLNFQCDIISQSTGKATALLAPKLLSAVCGDSPAALFVAGDGLFTCKPKSLLQWSPNPHKSLRTAQLHDGSRQSVPSIHSIQTLDVTYPVCAALVLPPKRPWTLVVIDARRITALRLSITLLPHEWTQILGTLTLPCLRDVGIWAPAITSFTSTSFLNHHAPQITALTYMAPVADALANCTPPLALPQLLHLTALAHYVVHIMSGRSPEAAFPSLTHAELWPDAAFTEALQLLSAHSRLTHITLWALGDPDDAKSSAADLNLDPALWPVFPAVIILELNKSAVEDPRLLALIARAFPALQHLHVNGSLPKLPDFGLTIYFRALEKRRAAFVSRIREANSEVTMFRIEGDYFL